MTPRTVTVAAVAFLTGAAAALAWAAHVLAEGLERDVTPPAGGAR